MGEAGVVRAGYRPEIDGLRAVAVLAVIGYHVGIFGFSGGFVGVDVFFVISGFLITGQLVQEREATGRIDLADFYARRVRRIVPALSLTILVSLLLGALFLTPMGEQQALGRSAIAAAGFVANFWFWISQADYFAAPADGLPLLHTWTLAVEEQFYILWPLVLLLVRGPRARPALLVLLLLGGAVSLILASYLAYWRGTAAFFLTPTRAWELAVGALLALWRSPTRPRPLAAEALGVIGVAAILGATFAFDVNTTFPGWRALAPVLGAAAVIAAGALSPSAIIVRLVGARPLAAIGRLSYGWYLWHWPLLAIVRVDGLGRNLPRDTAIAIAALGLAALTHRFVEQPIRTRRLRWMKTTRSTLVAGLVLLAVSMAAGLALWTSADRRLAASPRMAALSQAALLPSLVPAACIVLPSPLPAMTDPSRCFIGDKTSGRTLLLLGDSHGGHIAPALDVIGKQLGVRTLVRVQSACRPQYATPHARAKRPGATATDCALFNRRVWASLPALKHDYGVDAVVISAIWSDDPALEAEVQVLVDRLRAQELPVLLLLDVPSYPLSVPSCLARRPASRCDQSRAAVDASRAATVAAFHRIATRTPGVMVWDPVEALCNGARCPVERDGVALYRDRNHLTAAGSRLLAPGLEAQVQRLLAAGP